MNIILHIGLHKTGTKYFQHKVFPLLDKDYFLYNPRKLDQLVLDFLKADREDKSSVLKCLRRELDWIAKENPGKTILLSREAMAGNLFNAYKYWDESVNLLSAAFPSAKILVFLRNQVDWLVSCYRESVHEHHYQPISDFLSFNQGSGDFIVPDSSRNKAGFACLDALRLDYTLMLEKLFEAFDENKVKVCFFEHFKKDPSRTTADVLKYIGAGEISSLEDKEIPNRGYSALSIDLSIKRYQILKEKGLANLVHRPIFFYGKDSIPAGNIDLSVLDRKKYWGDDYLRDNEEVRSSNYPNLTEREQNSYEASWRYIVKKVLDKHNYVDWDILGDLRPPLLHHYTSLNCKLRRLLDRKDIPHAY